jgi:hypothetical protein
MRPVTKTNNFIDYDKENKDDGTVTLDKGSFLSSDELAKGFVKSLNKAANMSKEQHTLLDAKIEVKEYVRSLRKDLVHDFNQAVRVALYRAYKQAVRLERLRQKVEGDFKDDKS